MNTGESNLTEFVASAKIPETQPYQKEGSFVRSGEGDRKLSRYEIDRLAEERKQPKYDVQVVEEAQVEELDSELVEGFLRRERSLSPRVFAGLSDTDALLTMGVLGRDSAGEVKPTLAGIMALSRHPQRYFPRANVTFAVFPGSSKECLAQDGARFLDSRTIIGSIPVMVAETLLSLRRNMKMASYIDGAARRDVAEFPEVAVREAVANALMHRDYSPEGLGSQVQVNMYLDRIEIISPGGLYGTVTVNTLGQYGVSSTRNQHLSRILESVPYPQEYSEHGYVVENKGTGFAQMQLALRNHGLTPAEPHDSLSLFVIVMRKKGIEQQELPPLSVEQESIVHGVENVIYSVEELVREKGSVSTSEAARALSVSPATAYRRIKALVSKGVLRPADKGGRSSRYVFADRGSKQGCNSDI